MGSVEVSQDKEGLAVTLSVHGRFDYVMHHLFRDAYKALDRKAKLYQVNMKEVKYMDSSALGMLLLLREEANANGGKVSIIECNPDIYNILEVANFDKLFDIKK